MPTSRITARPPTVGWPTRSASAGEPPSWIVDSRAQSAPLQRDAGSGTREPKTVRTPTAEAGEASGGRCGMALLATTPARGSPVRDSVGWTPARLFVATEDQRWSRLSGLGRQAMRLSSFRLDAGLTHVDEYAFGVRTGRNPEDQARPGHDVSGWAKLFGNVVVQLRPRHIDWSAGAKADVAVPASG